MSRHIREVTLPIKVDLAVKVSLTVKAGMERAKERKENLSLVSLM
jgi:hypothetical protein